MTLLQLPPELVLGYELKCPSWTWQLSLTAHIPGSALGDPTGPRVITLVSDGVGDSANKSYLTTLMKCRVHLKNYCTSALLRENPGETKNTLLHCDCALPLKKISLVRDILDIYRPPQHLSTSCWVHGHPPSARNSGTKKKKERKEKKMWRIWAVFQMECLAQRGAGHSLFRMDLNHPCGSFQHRIFYDSKNNSIYSCYPIEQDSYFSRVLPQTT